MIKRLLGLGLIIIGGIGILNAVTKDNVVNINHLKDKHNLALRQVVHQLYLIAGDKTSKIASVENIQKTSYQIRVEKDLNYDTLPYLIDQAIIDFKLPKEYYVTIHECESDAILLGFNNRSVENQVIACQSREHDIKCSLLNITFPQEKGSTMGQTLSFGGVTMLGLFMLLWTLRSKATQKNNAEEATIENAALHLGQYQYDAQNLSLTINDKTTALTFRENKLLNYLTQNINQVIKREDIMAKVWEEEGLIVGRSLDVFISRLRKILKEDPNVQIKSVHGVGYRLVLKDKLSS